MAVILFGGGGWCLTSALFDVWNALASRNWPIAIGKVLGGSVKKRVARTFTDYFVDVTYSYSVDGQSYVGERAGFVKREKNCRYVPSAREAEVRLLHFPVGRSVNVMYSPRAPGFSTLETGVDFDGLLNRCVLLITGVLFLALCGLIGYALSR